MKKIIIKCKCLTSLNKTKYFVVIYDKNDNKICSGYTDNNGTITFNAKINTFYKITISHNYDIYPKTLNSAFIVSETSNNVITFVFGNFICNNLPSRKPITFILTDQMYENLPIERGTINLWPSLIQ